ESPPNVGRSWEEARAWWSQLVTLQNKPEPILIVGETGTGKERIARELAGSARPGREFVALNAASFSDPNTTEAMLVGWSRIYGEPGERPGYMELANEGTVFVDEVNSLSLSCQGVLLRCVESNRVRQQGSDREKEVDLLWLFASNRPLDDLVREGAF